MKEEGEGREREEKKWSKEKGGGGKEFQLNVD